MASPFRVFRKHQKAMLAVLTILTVISFSFGYYILDLLGIGRRGPENLVVVKTAKFGSLKQSDMGYLRSDRLKLSSVLANLLESAGIPAGQWSRSDQLKAPGSLTYLLAASGLPPQAAGTVEQILRRPSDEEMVNSWLLAHYAQRLGIVLSDDVINSFLQAATMDQVTNDKMQEDFHRAGLSAEGFFNLLRQELLAIKVKELFEPSLRPTTPAERWDYFNRIYRSATVEMIAVPVADYVAKVANPTEDELKKFFEDNKERVALPDSPKPGFHQPQRIALEYVKADVEKFADPKTITDQQIQEQYQKEKDAYQKDSYQELEKRLHPEKPAAEPEKKPAEPPPKGPATPQTKAPEPPKPPTEPPKAGGQPPQPAPTIPKATPKGPEPPAKDLPKEPAKGKDSVSGATSGIDDIGVLKASSRVSPFRLTAFAEEKKDEKKADAKAKPPLPAKPETPAPPPTPPAAGQKPPATGKEAPAKPAAQATKPQPAKTGLSDEQKDRIRRKSPWRRSTKSSPT